METRSARAYVRGGRRRTVWGLLAGSVSVPGDETRVLAETDPGSSTQAGVPSATLLRTRGMVKVYNTHNSNSARGALAVLFTSQNLVSGVDITAEYDLIVNGQRSYLLWYPWMAGSRLTGVNAAAADTFQFDPSGTAAFTIDSKGQHRVDGNDTCINLIATNDSTSIVTIDFLVRFLWMLP